MIRWPDARTLSTMAVVAVLVGVSYFVNRKLPEAPVADAAGQEALPRYTVYDVHWTRLGVDGLPALLGTADSIDYFDDQSAKLVHPTVTAIGAKAKIPWVLRAPTGHVPPNQHRVYLDNPVVADGSWPDGLPVKVTTTWVWIDSDLHQFFTDAKVTLDSSLRHGTAVGMLGDWREPATLHLIHDVKMTYVPNKPR